MISNLINQSFTELLPNTFKTENVSLFLYSLIKCVRPFNIIEVGCGYSTLFISEAIESIKKETLKNDQYFKNTDFAENYIQYSGGFYCPKFTVVDNLQHPDAPTYIEILKKQNLFKNITFIEKDIDDYLTETTSNFDFVWLDFGAPTLGHYKKFYKQFSSKLNAGGCIIIHSTITNLIARVFIAELKLELSKDNNYEIMSFVEPHKTNQNSFTVIKKLIDYPVYSVEA